MNGFNVINANQKQSLDTSKSNASSSENSNTNEYKGNSALDWYKTLDSNQIGNFLSRYASGKLSSILKL